MPTYVALLRSVNVAGHGRLAMADLKASFVSLGYRDVSTYIQTGNVIFSTPGRSTARLRADIERQLETDFGRTPDVMVRTVADLARVINTSPYPKAGADPSRHHVTFLAQAPDRAHLADFSPPPSGRDELVIIGQEVYVHTPDGYANTKLTGTLLERRLGVTSTTRNWNTVTKLGALLAG
ncbi:MAG TPA: DUF1697 domain-containing protein, partial [Acidimicrobiales bacterium]|jgi:uncharacterized protein (DUF1697 family)|nr:DUF1697 domain-containing protein [Acidimicrobiales bacterium]